ncbi:MAG: hypothetical protein PHF37_10965 [Phycisphaerae bacterium]|nr:hypothetical protein [Phycisphaerae bacterium]
MAYSISITKSGNFGGKRYAIGNINITSYTAGGEAVKMPESAFPRGTIYQVLLGGQSGNGFNVFWDNGKIVARGTGAEAKAAGAVVDAETNVGAIGFIAFGV